jgi:hypothetical protein
MPGVTLYALSLKQPWAALVAHGLKSIEVRSWPVKYRGPLLIHAAKINDERPEGWQYLTDEAQETAKLQGGVIAWTELVDCRFYGSLATFSRDQEKHRNAVNWYQATGLYGFVFGPVTQIPFHRWKGNVRLFRVTLPAGCHAPPCFPLPDGERVRRGG